jgi:hypothetical protein
MLMRRPDLFGQPAYQLFLFSAVASPFPTANLFPTRSDYHSSIFTSAGRFHLLQTLNKPGRKWRNRTDANGVIDWRVGRWLNARVSITIIDLEQ